LPVILYGYQIQSLTLNEEYKFQVFKNKEPSEIFRPKKGEVSEQFGGNLLFIQIVKMRKLQWAEHMARIGEPKN